MDFVLLTIWHLHIPKNHRPRSPNISKSETLENKNPNQTTLYKYMIDWALPKQGPHFFGPLFPPFLQNEGP